MRLIDGVGWFGPACLAFCVLGVGTPPAANVAVWLAAVSTVTLGVAHGALDHELAERLQHAPHSSTMRIAALYAAAVGAGFVAFLAAPLPMLGIFVVISGFHFGAADVAFSEQYARARRGRSALLRTISLGFFPIAIPVLAHPAAALTLLPHIATLRPLISNDWSAVRFALLGGAAIAVFAATLQRIRRPGTPMWYRYELAVAFAAFVIAPPAIAFLSYFGTWHAARHFLRLADAYGVDPQGEVPLRSIQPLVLFGLRALPMTAAAIALAGLLFALLARAVPIWTVAAALAFAVTIPHTFAVRFFTRVVAHAARSGKPTSRRGFSW